MVRSSEQPRRSLRASCIPCKRVLNSTGSGEVYVLNDGGEVDLDLGNYERYLNVTLSRDNNITTGKIYREVIEKEVGPLDCNMHSLPEASSMLAKRRISGQDCPGMAFPRLDMVSSHLNHYR